MANFIAFQNLTLPTFLVSSPTTASTSMAASLQSAPYRIPNSYICAMSFAWTGTPTGTLTVMGSVDGVNYNIQLATHATGGAAGNYAFDLASTAGQQTTCGWIMGVYTFTSGTGTLTSVVAAQKGAPAY